MRFGEVKKIITDPNNDKSVMIPLWKDYEHKPEIKPRYVYYTTIPANSKKGPYLHKKRRGILSIIEGKIVFVYKENGEYKEKILDSKNSAEQVDIPKGIAYQIINKEESTAKLINICDYPWIQGDNETEKPSFDDYNERIK